MKFDDKLGKAALHNQDIISHYLFWTPRKKEGLRGFRQLEMSFLRHKKIQIMKEWQGMYILNP